MHELLVFYILAGLLVLTSFSVVLTKNPVISAVCLIAHLFGIACLYALMGAHFVAAIQVLVYAGAIMVLFLFVIMLLNLKKEQLQGPRPTGVDWLVIALMFVTFCYAAYVLSTGEPSLTEALTQAAPDTAAATSNTFNVGMQLFTKYIWPFELASFLILLAIIASVVIARKEKATTPKV